MTSSSISFSVSSMISISSDFFTSPSIFVPLFCFAFIILIDLRTFANISFASLRYVDISSASISLLMSSKNFCLLFNRDSNLPNMF
jgi:uncharacterized membrane protein YadS